MKNENGITEEVRFQELHEHYEKTLSSIEGEIKKRNKLVLLILATIWVGVLFTLQTTVSINAVSQFLSSGFGTDFDTDFYALVIATIWFLNWPVLVCFVVWYMQIVSHIEKRWRYIYQLEKILQTPYGEDSIAFTRESSGNLEKYPGTSVLEWFIHKIFLPFIFLSIIFGSIAVVSTAKGRSGWSLFLQENFGDGHALFLLGIILIAGCCVSLSILIPTPKKSVIQEQKKPKPPANK